MRKIRHSMAYRQADHHLLTGIAAGLLAGAVTRVTDRVLDRLVSAEQKKHDNQVREAPAHQVAGPVFAEKITGRKITGSGVRRSQTAFTLAYGIGWGILYAMVRRRFPHLSRPAALPFGILHFAVCDGFLAPLLRMSPPLRKIPWQPSAKELANHIAWAASAEMVHRAAARKS
jgi:uncharacterized membrane protein YagU involved in acid resistance